MNIRKFTVCLCLVAGLLAAGTADARFRGGAIEDVENRIKQAVETAKQSEILTQYKEITENLKEITSAWSGLRRSADALYADVSDSFLTRPVSAFLRADTADELKAARRERTEFDFLDYGGNTGKARKENMRRLMDLHEEDFAGSVDAAAENHNLSEEIYRETGEISSSLTDGGAYSVRQKQAMLAAQTAVTRNMKAATLAQDAMTDYERTLMAENRAAEAGAFAMEQSISIPDENDPLYQQNIEKYRMKELPK